MKCNLSSPMPREAELLRGAPPEAGKGLTWSTRDHGRCTWVAAAFCTQAGNLRGGAAASQAFISKGSR